MLEKKKHAGPYFRKRLFKLVFVLFKLQTEMPKDDIWRQLQMQTFDDSTSNGTSVLGAFTPSDGANSSCMHIVVEADDEKDIE